LLRLPARTAFGVGSHESTRLALELLESLDLAGRRVLDVGTGTGILAFAALCRGAGWTLGIDHDPAAALVAAENARLNGLRPALAAAGVGALGAARRFDVVLLNVVPGEIAADLPALARLLAAGADVVVSGILRPQGRAYLRRLRALGWRRRRTRRAGEWVAYRLRVA
jgi:ribosomal protein L11 methyltransferase